MNEFHWISSKIPPKDDGIHLLIMNSDEGIEFDHGFYRNGEWHYRGAKKKEVITYTTELFSMPDFYNIVHLRLE